MKITDGDLLIVSTPKDLPDKAYAALSTSINTWLKSKGLTNVEVISAKLDIRGLEFSVLSANDAFENEILK